MYVTNTGKQVMVNLNPMNDDEGPVIGQRGDFNEHSMSSSGFDANDRSMMEDSFND